jgi:PncC family amidohydrolase
MKSLLVIQRWSETESLTPSSGRPYLDLFLNCLGFAQMDILELEAGEPFDLGKIDEDVRLILVQGQKQCCNAGSGRLRRSLLSSLSLSLGLDAENSDRLRVVGARPLHDEKTNSDGFVIKRHGRIVAYFENSIWDLNKPLHKGIHTLLSEERSSRRIRFQDCWLVEGAGHSLDMSQFLDEEEGTQCHLKYLPNGDVAVLIPTFMGDEFRKRLQERLANHLYSLIPQPLEEGLGDLLREHKATITVAESCTAGLISARLASTPGSSDYLLSGFVTYSAQAKTKSLGISEVQIKQFGEVSKEMAIAMARGALRTSGSTLAVAVTGIAGPGGGTVDKPVGTVFLAVVSSDGKVIEHQGLYKGNRDRIRYQASQTALHLVRRILVINES